MFRFAFCFNLYDAVLCYPAQTIITCIHLVFDALCLSLLCPDTYALRICTTSDRLPLYDNMRPGYTFPSIHPDYPRSSDCDLFKYFFLHLDPINLPAVQSEARSFIMITTSWTFHRSIHTSCFRGVQNYFLFFMTCNNSFQYACMICRIYVDFA